MVPVTTNIHQPLMDSDTIIHNILDRIPEPISHQWRFSSLSNIHWTLKKLSPMIQPIDPYSIPMKYIIIPASSWKKHLHQDLAKRKSCHDWDQVDGYHIPPKRRCPEIGLPSGNLLHSYWKWPFIVDFPIHSMVIFHSYIKLPEGTPKSSILGFETFHDINHPAIYRGTPMTVATLMYSKDLPIPLASSGGW